jgi:hypothetical protein
VLGLDVADNAVYSDPFVVSPARSSSADSSAFTDVMA